MIVSVKLGPNRDFQHQFLVADLFRTEKVASYKCFMSKNGFPTDHFFGISDLSKTRSKNRFEVIF